MEQFSEKNEDFYEKYTGDDLNMQANIKAILNLVHENRGNPLNHKKI